jgi:integrase
MHEPYRHPKTGIYWVKGSTPQEVRDSGGPKQFNRSLGTRNAKEVEAALSRVLLRLKGEWEAAAMAKTRPAKSDGKPKVNLSDTQIRALAGGWYEERLRLEEQEGKRHEELATLLAVLTDDPKTSQVRGVMAKLVEDLLQREELHVNDDTHARLLREMQHLYKALYERLLKHTEGDFSEPRERFPQWERNTPAPKQAAPGFSLTALYEAWVKAVSPAIETIPQWRSVTKHLVTFLGHDDAHRVTEADLERWRDHLREQGKGGKRIKDGYIAAVRAVFGWAVREKKLGSNPAANVHVTVPKRVHVREKDFTDAEAKLILTASRNATEAKDTSDLQAARRWVPWLLAYSGARVAEITQLRKEDIIEERGIAGMRITPDAGSTKTRKPRSVPVHPHLIEQGFLQFVAAQSDGPLFYDPKKARGSGELLHKKRADQLAAWVREIGVTDPNVDPNHGWRHRFKTEARRVRMDTEIRDYIQGHAMRTEGENYGHMPLDVTFPWIKQMARYEVD